MIMVLPYREFEVILFVDLNQDKHIADVLLVNYLKETFIIELN